MVEPNEQPSEGKQKDSHAPAKKRVSEEDLVPGEDTIKFGNRVSMQAKDTPAGTTHLDTSKLYEKTESAISPGGEPTVTENIASEQPTVGINTRDDQATVDIVAHAWIGGRYKPIGSLGKGGMGAVYKVEDTEQGGKILALKITLEDASSDDEEHVARFKREIASMQKFQHPNIVQVYDAGKDGNKLFFTMDYVPGVTLYSAILRKEVNWEQGAKIISKIAKAVHCAHQQGVVHRDLKPANIMLKEAEEPILMDFGVAKVLEAHTRLTQTGYAVGTPFYMSPEQAMASSDIDGRSDVFALGTILYQLLTGELPFHKDSVRGTLKAIAQEDPVPPRNLNSKISPFLESVCLRALAKNPQSRYQTAKELAEDLQSAIHGTSDSRSPKNGIPANTRLILLNALFLAIVAVILWFVLKN